VGETPFEVVGMQDQAAHEGRVILVKIEKPSRQGSVFTKKLQGG